MAGRAEAVEDGDMNLSEAQRRALEHLAQYPNEWRGDTPTTQKCLNVLHERGLVKVAYEPGPGWNEMITPAGIEAISEI